VPLLTPLPAIGPRDSGELTEEKGDEVADFAKMVFLHANALASMIQGGAGITNATAESLNRLAYPAARCAYGFRNPLSQRRRVRIARARGYRRKTRPAATTFARLSAVLAGLAWRVETVAFLDGRGSTFPYPSAR